MSPLIVGAAEHLNDTTLTYVEEKQPPNVDARIVAGVSATLREQYNAENDELKEWWARKMGFERGTIENIHNALDEQYYRALKQKRFG